MKAQTFMVALLVPDCVSLSNSLKYYEAKNALLFEWSLFFIALTQTILRNFSLKKEASNDTI